MHLRRTIALLFAAIALVAGCGDDDDEPDAAEAADEVENPGPDEPAPGELGDETIADWEAEAEADLEFFRSTEEACAEHAAETDNPPVDPARFADAGAGFDESYGKVLVEDGAGTLLDVNTEDEEIYGPEGPESEMPRPYSFSCPEDIYVGTVS